MTSSKAVTVTTFVLVVFSEWAVPDAVDALNTDGHASGGRVGVVPLEAEREEVPEGLAFTVRYRTEPGVLADVQWWNTGNNWQLLPETKNSGPTGEDGIYQTRVIAPQDNSSRIILELGSYNFWYSLVLEKAQSGERVESPIPIPPLQIHPLGDIVYQPGEDAELQVTVRCQDVNGSDVHQPGHDLSLISWQTVLFNPHTGLREEDNEIVSIVDKFENSDGLTVVQLRVNTSLTPLSGLINLATRCEHEGSLVQMVLYARQKVLRPSTQDGPFPPGHIAFENHGHTTRNGTEIIYCGTSAADCFVYCTVVGTDISFFHLEQILSKRRRVDANIAKAEPSQTFFQYGYTGQQTGSPGTVLTFVCTAGNNGGKLLSRISKIIFYQEVNIVETASSVEWYNSTTVNATCVVKGDYDLVIRLNLYYLLGDVRYYEIHPEDTLMAPDNTTVASVLVNRFYEDPFDAYTPSGHIHSENPVTNITCEAMQEGDNHYMSHDIYDMVVDQL